MLGLSLETHAHFQSKLVHLVNWADWADRPFYHLFNLSITNYLDKLYYKHNLFKPDKAELASGFLATT